MIIVLLIVVVGASVYGLWGRPKHEGGYVPGSNAEGSLTPPNVGFKTPTEPVICAVGPYTMERVFLAHGITNLSNFQQVLDAVETALVDVIKAPV